MNLIVKLFAALFVLLLSRSELSAQASGNNQAKSLEQFQRIASAEGRFDYFFSHPEGYGRHFEGDWKQLLSEQYRQAEAVGDTVGGLFYGAVLARVLLDKGEVIESLRLGERIYAQRERNLAVEEPILATLYEGYRQIGHVSNQVEIFQKQRAKGYPTVSEVYQIYEDAGDYVTARQEFVNLFVSQLKADTLQRVFYYNKLGWYRIKLRKNLGDAMENLVRADSLLNTYLRSPRKSSNSEEYQTDVLDALNTSYQGWCLLLTDKEEQGLSQLTSGIRSLESLKSAEVAHQRIELIHALSDILVEKRYYRQLGRYLRDIDGEGDLAQQAHTMELQARYYYELGDYRRSHNYSRGAFDLHQQLLANQQRLINLQSLVVLNESEAKGATSSESPDAQLSFEKMKSEQDRILGLTLSLVLVLMGFIGLVFAYVKSVKHTQVILEQKKFIEKSLREKESLLKEIHHRVRNNLQMVSSLLSLQTKNTRDKAAIVALEEGKSRVKAMALIHQKLYQNDKLSSVGMQEYIESLVKSIQQVYKRSDGEIDVRIDARGTDLDIDQAIPIGLILNELVSNSFKHAFPYPSEDPAIQIQVKYRNGQGYFEYSDNGVGLPPDSEQKSKSSMGIRLVNRLVNQLQSQLNTDSTRVGVRFWFTF